jgi:hypothetical protein
MTDTKPADVWIWEYGTRDGSTVHTADEFPTLDELKKTVADCFTDYTWEEVERRGIRGTSILVNQYGRYKDTGHWVYRKPQGPVFPGTPGSRWRDADGDMWMLGDDGFMRLTYKRTAPDEVAKTFGPMTLAGGGS